MSESETVALADGDADQTLLPGVEPVANSARKLADLRQRRELRRGNDPLPAGGLFDEEGQRQQQLL